MRAAPLLLMLALLTLGACDRMFSDLTIRNESSVKASNIVVEYGDRRSALGDLEPGSNTRFKVYMSGEGVGVIHYTIKGKRLSYDSCYYTGGMPLRGEVAIRDNGVARRCD
jgi:hypothetical protein